MLVLNDNTYANKTKVSTAFCSFMGEIIIKVKCYGNVFTCVNNVGGGYVFEFAFIKYTQTNIVS